MSTTCLYEVHSITTNNDGSHCCLGCMKSSGKNHGPICEKLLATPNIYTQNIAEVTAAKGLPIWTKSQFDIGLGSATDYRKATNGNVISISGAAAEIHAAYSNIKGSTIPASETDTYQTTGNIIRFIESTNKILQVWSEVTNSETNETFYIVTTCSDATKYDPVLVTKA